PTAGCGWERLNIMRSSVGCAFFFFQAEDGIRDKLVTGVQTCALPILQQTAAVILGVTAPRITAAVSCTASRLSRKRLASPCQSRSEERRVGKECRSRGWPHR